MLVSLPHAAWAEIIERLTAKDLICLHSCSKSLAGVLDAVHGAWQRTAQRCLELRTAGDADAMAALHAAAALQALCARHTVRPTPAGPPHGLCAAPGAHAGFIMLAPEEMQPPLRLTPQQWASLALGMQLGGWHCVCG